MGDWLLVTLAFDATILLVAPYYFYSTLIPAHIHFPLTCHIIALLLYLRWVPKESVAFRSLHAWEWFRTTYFGIELRDPHNTLNNGKSPQIFAVYPHGVYATTVIFQFALNPQMLHVKPVGTSLLFTIPLIKEFVGLGGAIPANRASILSSVACGDSVALCPGGLRELVSPVVVKRLGFLKIAMATNTPVVPVWSPHETRLYRVWVPFPQLQGWLLTLFLYPFPLSWGLWWLPFWPKPPPGGLPISFGQPLVPQDYKNVHEFQDAFYTALDSLQT